MTKKKRLTKKPLEKIKKKALREERGDVVLSVRAADNFLAKYTRQKFLPK